MRAHKLLPAVAVVLMTSDSLTFKSSYAERVSQPPKYKGVPWQDGSPLARKLSFLDEILSDYDNRAWPTYGTGEATNVTVSLVLNSMGPLEEANMDYTVDLDLQEVWKDERLELYRFDFNDSLTINGGNILDRIWKPDLFFVNAKEASTHDVTVPNQMVQIALDGTVTFSLRITLRLSCLMNFQLFPMDRQKCNIFIRPYAHTDDKVQLFWRGEEPALLQFSNDMPEFDLIDFYSGSFTRYHHTGNFSSLNLVFLLERDPGYYLIHMYLPLTLTVLMSWHALWFKVEIPQARMVLSVNCLFTAVTVANDARSSIPRVSYLKMADVWITACILFIYGLILVSSMVNYMSRMKLRPVFMRKVDQGLGDMWHVWKHGTPSDDFLLKLDKANKLEHHRNLKRSESVERNARYLFPICFIFFNIVYWPFYVRRTYETL